MLRRISCSGFKSFDDFSLEFNPGLNVLVGPNGSGKSNIILLLEFLSRLRNSSLMEAIGQIGGAGAIFRRTTDGLLKDTITVSLEGEGIYKDYRYETNLEGSYKFDAEIKLSTVENSVVFGKQHLNIKIKNSKKEDGTTQTHEKPIEFDISTDIDPIEKKIRTKINHYDRQVNRLSSRKDLEEIRKIILESCDEYSKNIGLFSFLDRFIRGAHFIVDDLQGAKAFNISPENARAPEDVASIPVIQADGSGLAATLFALRNAASPRSSYLVPFFMSPRRDFENAESIMRQIIEHAQLINDSVQSIDVESDAYDGKLRIYVNVEYEDKVLKLPFNLVSDGTAKWFTLVTAILTNRSLFSIEEPENFLHPAMQAEVIRLLRNQYETVYRTKFALLTTHSETILNNVRPEEVIVVRMNNGKTTARRPENVEDLNIEIRNTGFGLGFYYISEAIE
jgi:predicted ATPase